MSFESQRSLIIASILAPASINAGARLSVIPPIAQTGVAWLFHACSKDVCAAAAVGFVGEGKKLPKAI
jgi:hypothetical protein